MAGIKNNPRGKDIVRVDKVLSMYYRFFDKNFNFLGEEHDSWEVVYVDSGKVIITAAENTHILSQGDIIFHRPGEFHAIKCDNKTPSTVFVISFECRSSSMNYFASKRAELTMEQRRYITTLINEAEAAYGLPFDMEYEDRSIKNGAPIGASQMIRTTLEQLLITLMRSVGRAEDEVEIQSYADASDGDVAKAVKRLLKNSVYSRLTLNDVCRKLNYSRAYVSRAFSLAYGKTIIQYYTEKKISEAKKLLKAADKSVAEISALLCFGDARYFSRVFKKATGMTPREYTHSVSE